MTEFAIHSLPVLNGDLALSAMPGRAKQYAADWQRVLAWQPQLVLSMTSQASLDGGGAGTLAQDLAGAGIGWLHLPVEDFGVPADLDWPHVRDQALDVLAGGGRVLVHCYAGCGRSGMIVLRLMIAIGEDADAALERLRAVRPCAVETDDQMRWARQG